MTDIKEILKRYWGYDDFRSLQEEIILSVISGKDTLALMPTGGGKSITYQVAALAKEGICVVVTPLIALMKDQVGELLKRDIPAVAIYTGQEKVRIESAINRCIGGKVKFLYVSPERLSSPYFRARLRQMNVTMLTVDEAHCISQWGYDFRPSYLKIAEIRDFFPGVPVLALTATATPAVVEDIQQQLKFAGRHVLTKSFRRENIAYVVRKANDKLGELLHILSRTPGCVIVYVRKRDRAEELAAFLTSNGIRADYYHAGLSAMQREKKQINWKNDTVPVIVATNAFGMGIDKPDVRCVVHYDIPDSPEGYFQEAGRAGRDGQKAYAVLLYNEATLTALKKRIDNDFPERKYIREVYRALGNFFQLEEGEGAGKAYEFDTDLFVKTFKLDHARTVSAIHLLQVAGYLEATTEVHSRSRVYFRVMRDYLYKVEFENHLQERLVEMLLRTCPGVFAQYAYIDEQFIADRQGTDREHIYKELIALAKRKILSYVPGNDRPYIVYHQPKLPPSYLHIGREIYEDRKHSYSLKVDRMIHYVETQDSCRQLILMDYFGQKEKQPCGICDLCLVRKKDNHSIGKGQIDRAIIELLQQHDYDTKQLIRSLSYDEETVVRRLRLLLDENKIYYKTPALLSLR